ncbi:hypothetical protein [Cohnella sp. GCM10027633]|uniref:hypothetical protein n=1 Tax=unclassified Cohnella TaxID=2636738 RepID=UPI00362BA95B
MSLSNPDWNMGLKGEPLRSNGFTSELANRVRTEVLRVPKHGKRAYFIGSVSVSIALFVLLSYVFTGSGEPLPRVGQEHVAASSANIPVHEDHYDIPLSESLDDFVLNNNRFYFRTDTYSLRGHQSIKMIMDYYRYGKEEVRHEAGKPNGSVSYSVLLEGGQLPESRRVTSASFASNGVVLFFGMLDDPGIVDIRAVQRNEEMAHHATIVKGQDGHTYWYIAIADNTNDSWRYRLEGLNAEGKSVAEESDFIPRY